MVPAGNVPNAAIEIVTGPGGKQILAEDPSGNVVELFQPAAARA